MDVTNNLEMAERVRKDVGRLYTNTTPLYRRGLSILRFSKLMDTPETSLTQYWERTVLGVAETVIIKAWRLQSVQRAWKAARKTRKKERKV